MPVPGSRHRVKRVLSEPQSLVLMLRALECSDLAELSFSRRLEANGVLGEPANF